MKFKEIKSKLKKTKYYDFYKNLKDKNFLFTSLFKSNLNTKTNLNNKKVKRVKLIKFFGIIPKNNNILSIPELSRLKKNIKLVSLFNRQLSNKFIQKIKLKSSIKKIYYSRINSIKNNSSLFLSKLKFKGNKKSNIIQKKAASESLTSIFKNSNLETLKNFYKKLIPINKESIRKSSNDHFLVIHYSDHILTVSKVLSDNNLNKIDQIININIPTAIVGDYKVENTDELKNILRDIIELFEIQDNPVLLLLSSGFFTINSFDDGELVVFSENNPQLLSKSPFLPDDTLIQYSRVSGNKLTSFHRVVYVNKTILDTWIEVLSQLENPIAGVTCSSIHLVEELTNKYGGLNVLCDIESSYTTVYIERENCELNTIKLPFGTSIYTSEDSELALQFFQRLEKSIFSILKKFKYKKPNSIYVIGQGFDKLNIKNLELLTKFKEYPQDIFNKFDLNKDIDQETISNNSSNLIRLSSIIQMVNK